MMLIHEDPGGDVGDTGGHSRSRLKCRERGHSQREPQEPAAEQRHCRRSVTVVPWPLSCPEPHVETPEPSWSMSFAGCGFRALYYVGALCCLLELAPDLVQKAKRFSGASSGSLIAAALAVDLDLCELCVDLVAMAAESRRLSLNVLSPSFSLLRRARDALLQRLPSDAHERATGRLCVSLTRIRDGSNVIVSEFSSRHELVQVLLCSCFFPVYCGFIPPTYKGESYMDGALSDNQPLLEFRNTVTFSPFSGESDICPKETGYSFVQVCFGNVSIEVNTGNVYRVWTSFIPQTPQVLMEICLSGYTDALRFLESSAGLDQPWSQTKSFNNEFSVTDSKTLPQQLRAALVVGSDPAFRPAHFSQPPVGSKVLGLVLDLVLVVVRLLLLPLGLVLRLFLRVLSLCSLRSPSSNLHYKDRN